MLLMFTFCALGVLAWLGGMFVAASLIYAFLKFIFIVAIIVVALKLLTDLLG